MCCVICCRPITTALYHAQRHAPAVEPLQRVPSRCLQPPIEGTAVTIHSCSTFTQGAVTFLSGYKILIYQLPHSVPTWHASENVTRCGQFHTDIVSFSSVFCGITGLSLWYSRLAKILIWKKYMYRACGWLIAD